MKNSAISHYRIIPADFGFYPIPGLYYSRHAAEKMYSNQIWSAAVLYGGLMLVAAFITWMFIRRIKSQYRNVGIVIGSIALLGIAGIVTVTVLSGFHTAFAAALSCGLGIFAASLTSGLARGRL